MVPDNKCNTLHGAFTTALSRGQVELARGMLPLMQETDEGKALTKSLENEILKYVLDPEQKLGPDPAPLYTALRYLYCVNENGIDSRVDLLQIELLLRQYDHILLDPTKALIRSILYGNQELGPSLKRKIGHYITLNPTLIDICKNIPDLPYSLLKYFIDKIVNIAGLEEAFQSNIISCLKRAMQKDKEMSPYALSKYLLYIDVTHMSNDTKRSFQTCLVHFISHYEDYKVERPSLDVYKVCLSASLDDNNIRLLASVLKEIRDNERLSSPTTEVLSSSFENYVIAALYDTLDNNTCFIEDLLNSGLKILQRRDYDKINKMFGSAPFNKLKPLLLALAWDSCDNHHDQARLLEVLSYTPPLSDRFIRYLYNVIREQVDVGMWCEEHVKPLLMDSWNSAAASTVTSSRSILHVIISLECIERLGQEKVLGLMFNFHDKSAHDPNDLPLSEAPTIDQGKDIVTFCSAMVILNIVSWLEVVEGDKTETLGSSRNQKLLLAEKHLSRVYPLYNRATVLRTAFSALIHSLKNPKSKLSLSECGELLMWFEQQINQFEKDKEALSMGHFDTVKVFRELSNGAPDFEDAFNKIKDAVSEAKWRIDLLNSLLENKRKKRTLSRQLASSLISFMCSTPEDLLKLCLIYNHTDRAFETLHRFQMETAHLAQVVNFQKDYATCLMELEKFAAALRKQAAVPSSRARSNSTSSSSSVTSSVSTMSRVSHVSSIKPVSTRLQVMRNIAVAANRSAERTKVPAIVSKLTSTLTKQQLMIECENNNVDKETLIARLFADLACSISAPKVVGSQLLSLALERLQENPLPDSPVETYIKKLNSVMNMLDAKPYAGITVSNSSVREFLNSIYPCISHDVFYDLLEFNENQDVTYNDLQDAINDKGPVNVVRMKGVLESAREVLNMNNYTTFLSTHDKHRDYLGALITYLQTYCDQFNESLAATEFEVTFSPSEIFTRSPQYHIGELVLGNEIHPKILTPASEYLSLDMLQLIVISSFPHVCIEEKPGTLPSPMALNIESHMSCGSPNNDEGEDNSKVCKILSSLQDMCGAAPSLTYLPINQVMMHLQNTRVRFNESECSGMDLVRLLSDCISNFKTVSKLQPSRFDPFYLFGLLIQNKDTRYTEENLRHELMDNCRAWLGNHAFLGPEGHLHLALHPLAYAAILFLRYRKDFLKEFLCVYTDVVCEFLGSEIEGMLQCERNSMVVLDHNDEFYLGKNKHSMIKIVMNSCFDFRYKKTCNKCKDIDRLYYRSELRPKSSAFDYVEGHNKCLGSLGYVFRAMDIKDLSNAGLIIDEALLFYPSLQNYFSTVLQPLVDIIDNGFIDIFERCNPDLNIKQDIIGCLLFGNQHTKLLVHFLGCLVEYNTSVGRYSIVKNMLSTETGIKVFGQNIPDIILLLSLDFLDPRNSPTFLAHFMNMNDKLMGLEYIRMSYEDWPIGVAIECFVYHSEVLSHIPDCVAVISSCLDRCYTMSRISKILNYLEVVLTTCKTVETYIKRRPEDFIQLLVAHKEFEMCHNAVKLGLLSDDFKARLLAEHVVFMAQNDNYDSLDIYNLLDKNTTEEVGMALCSHVQQYTNNLNIVLQLIDLILDKFEHVLCDEMRLKLGTQRLGAQCFKVIKDQKIQNYEEYSHLLFQPIILLEQLIMNFQIHLSATIVQKYQGDFLRCKLKDELDSLIEAYIEKSLLYEGIRKSSDAQSTITTYTAKSMMGTTKRRKPLTVFDPPYKPNKRISSVQSPATYKIPSKPGKWVDSKKVKRCSSCRKRFTMVLRKHHCRWCGQVMCDACSPVKPPTSYFGASVRLCSPCYMFIQEVRYSTFSEQDTSDFFGVDNTNLYDLPFELLSTNKEINLEKRDSYSFIMAPSSELCLYLSRIMTKESGEILLEYSEKLSEILMECMNSESNLDHNHTHILGVIESVLKEARNSLRQQGITSKSNITDIYIAYIQICRRISSSDLIGMPSLKSLCKPETLNQTYMKLYEKQYPDCAITLCTKAGRDPLGLWRKWGFACLRMGDYPAAREKLEMCLKNKQYCGAIVEDIIRHTENCVPSILVEITDITEFIDGMKKKCKKGRMNYAEFEECVYYLSTYSTPVRLLKFYVKHDTLNKAAQLAIKHADDYMILFDGVIIPLANTGKLQTLFDYINKNRADYQTWMELLTACCKPLAQKGNLDIMFEIQIFTSNYLNAARTAIMMLRNSMFVVEQDKLLTKAEDCFKSYLDPANQHSLTISGSINTTSSIHTINTRLSHIHLQRQILTFLRTKNIKENNLHIFSSKSDKADIIKALYKIDNIESLALIKNIIDTFSLSYKDTYLPMLKDMVNVKSEDNIVTWFPKIIKILADVPVEEQDAILLGLSYEVKSNQKIFERIVAIMKTDSSKIKAIIDSGNLRKAYLLAVDKNMRSEIERLLSICEEQGNTQVRDFCKKYLEHNKAKQ